MENQRDNEAPRRTYLDVVLSPSKGSKVAGNRRQSSKFDPQASDGPSPSPLVKYLCSADPEAAAGPSPVFRTPVKVEEDVIVMDGIPVPDSNRRGGEPRMRLPMTSSNSAIGGSAGGRSNSTSSSSGGGGRGSGGYKSKLCRFWEKSGTCQFGTECQFAHGTEELARLRPSAKIRPAIAKLNYNLEGSSSTSYGTSFPTLTEGEEEAPLLPSVSTGMAFATSSLQVNQISGTTSSPTIPDTTLPKSDLSLQKDDGISETTISSPTIPNANLPIPNWTPQDDGIEVSLPGSAGENNPSAEDVNARIEKVLYGTDKKKKRLPVFEKFCPN